MLIISVFPVTFSWSSRLISFFRCSRPLQAFFSNPHSGAITGGTGDNEMTQSHMIRDTQISRRAWQRPESHHAFARRRGAAAVPIVQFLQLNIQFTEDHLLIAHHRACWMRVGCIPENRAISILTSSFRLMLSDRLFYFWQFCRDVSVPSGPF